MGQHGIASILLVVSTGLTPIAAHHGLALAGGAGADPSPTPAVSFSATETSPVLTQQSARLWTTSIVVDVFPACLRGLRYELVTTWPDESVSGQVAAVVSLGPEVPGGPSGQSSSGTSGSQPSCTATAALSSEWPSEVDLHFSTSFQAIPRGAAVVLEAPDGIMTLPAITLTVHRQVTRVDYLLIPACCGLALILLFLLAVITAVARDDVRDQDGRKARLRQLYRDVIRNDGEFWKVFWRRPLFASAAWTFKDSWATNVTVGVSATGAILAAFGTVSTLFPGVQLDRFAILMAICGAIIAVAPLVFGIASAWQPGPYLTLPDNSLARAPAGEPVILQAVAGASISLPTGTRKNGARATRKATKMPVPANPCPPIEISGRWIALTKDGTVAAAGGSTIRIGSPPHTSIEVGDDGAVVTVVGVADLTLPSGTEVITSASAAPDRPESAPSKLGQEAIVKVPPAGNVMDADMRSVVPAAMVTMFGIGAELGILGVMAWSLSAESTVIRACTVAVLTVAALIVVGYAGSTTRSLADSGLGSALSASSTSFTY
jgi:hypothetical protein